jgi:hypothetical protein
MFTYGYGLGQMHIVNPDSDVALCEKELDMIFDHVDRTEFVRRVFCHKCRDIVSPMGSRQWMMSYPKSSRYT